MDHGAQRRDVVLRAHFIGQLEQAMELRGHHVAVGDLVAIDQLAACASGVHLSIKTTGWPMCSDAEANTSTAVW